MATRKNPAKTKSKKKQAVKRLKPSTASTASKQIKKLSLTPIPVASGEQLKLWQSSSKDLENIMRDGVKPTISQLDGWRFRGLNVGFGARVLGIQKFIKAFYEKDYQYGKLITGHNIVVKQNRPEDEYIKITKKGRHKIQGVYLVEAGNQKWQKFKSAAMLNYGRGDNAWHEPAKFLRDYLVQPYSDNPDLLVGKAYFAVGPLLIFGGYFILERLEKIE